MRIVLFGKHGQLGWELFNSLQSLGQVYAYDWPDIDLLAPASIKRLIVALHPDMVINAAAFTNVDKAESEAEHARLINTEAPSLMAETCRTLGAAFVHYSTDYVFDGNKGTPYMEDDIPNPLNVYGGSKLEGEHAVLAAGGINLILRTAWVYGTSKDNFVNKVLRWAHSQSEMRIVEDQVSNPTWARALAKITTHLIVNAGLAPWPGWTSIEDSTISRVGVSQVGWIGRKPSCGTTLGPILNLYKESFQHGPWNSQPRLQGHFFSALDCSKFEKTFALRLPDWESTLSLAMRTQIGIDYGSEIA